MKWNIRNGGASVERSTPQFFCDNISYHPAYTKVLHIFGGYVLRNVEGEEVDVILVEKNGERLQGTENHPDVDISAEEREALFKSLGW